MARRLYRIIRGALATFGALCLIYFLCFDLSEVRSPSMAPTLDGSERGDWLLSEKISFRCRNPKRWELIRFRSPDGVDVIKRVVGLPGETVDLREGRVFINGLPAPFPSSIQFLHYYAFGPYFYLHRTPTVDANGFFVFGDYSKDSQDSRYEGTLPKERITARPWLRVWPWSRIGFVNP